MDQERASLEVQAAKDLAQAELEAARRETKWRERCEAAEAGARETRADMERRLASLAHKLAAAAKKDEKRKRAKGALHSQQGATNAADKCHLKSPFLLVGAFAHTSMKRKGSYKPCVMLC